MPTVYTAVSAVLHFLPCILNTYKQVHIYGYELKHASANLHWTKVKKASKILPNIIRYVVKMKQDPNTKGSLLVGIVRS